MFDLAGNIWIANCANNTVTRYAGGNPSQVTSYGDAGAEQPFGIATDARGKVFVTGNGNNTVAILGPYGKPIPGSPITRGLDKPLGIVADMHGDMWVANSASVNMACPGGVSSRANRRGSILLIPADGTASGRPFTGGGLTFPWGVAVDGHDNVWVSNFGGQRVSEFCGVNSSECPAGLRTGEPISPDTGYGFDGLTRNTCVEIDPSGNVWITNNWKQVPQLAGNPGGLQMVVFVGVAGPIKTPLIGPPQPS